MTQKQRHTDFAEFDKGERVAVHFRVVPRTDDDDARRLQGEIVALYNDEKAMIETDSRTRWIVDFDVMHENNGVRRHRGDGEHIGGPYFVEPA